MKTFVKAKRLAENFFACSFFDFLLFLLAVFITLTGREVKGLFIFIGVICIELLLCRDTSVTLLPFLLLCTFMSTQFDSADIYLPFVPLAFPIIAVIVLHFIIYRKKFRLGPSFYTLCAVALAITLGGLFSISKKEYFDLTALGYNFALGIGMVGIYLLFKSHYTADSDEESEHLRRNLVKTFYLMGLLACFVILGWYQRDFNTFLETRTVLSFPSRNEYPTFIMFALPFPFYLTMNTEEKRSGGGIEGTSLVKYSDLHLLSALFMYFCLLLSGSRGGLIFGTVEFVLCFTVCVYMRGGGRRLVYFVYALICVAVFVKFSDFLLDLYSRRTQNGLFDSEEIRFELIARAIEDFKSNKIFGRGLGYQGNRDLYAPPTGAMDWYHVYPAQILGSFGLLGAAAFGSMIVQRFYLFLHKPGVFKLTLGLSYIGILMMSLVNPGEFCPVPYEIMTVLLFIYLENEKEPI